eukprot:768416-Hanusia_phi.AAC.3
MRWPRGTNSRSTPLFQEGKVGVVDRSLRIEAVITPTPPPLPELIKGVLQPPLPRLSFEKEPVPCNKVATLTQRAGPIDVLAFDLAKSLRWARTWSMRENRAEHGAGQGRAGQAEVGNELI